MTLSGRPEEIVAVSKKKEKFMISLRIVREERKSKLNEIWVSDNV